MSSKTYGERIGGKKVRIYFRPSSGLSKPITGTVENMDSTRLWLQRGEDSGTLVWVDTIAMIDVNPPSVVEYDNTLMSIHQRFKDTVRGTFEDVVVYDDSGDEIDL